MEKNIISSRIKHAMSLKGMTQSEIIEKTKITKSALSSYISGKYSPKQTNIYKIAKCLNVNPAWLMGYDVPINESENYGFELINENMANNYINLSQLSIMTKISLNSLADIINGKNKLPNPKDLDKIAKALNEDVYDYFIVYGYVEDPLDNDNKLYKTGVRYLLSSDERLSLCQYLTELWNKRTNSNEFTKENVYKTIFNEEKNTFSINEVKNIMKHNTNINNYLNKD